MFMCGAPVSGALMFLAAFCALMLTVRPSTLFNILFDSDVSVPRLYSSDVVPMGERASQRHVWRT